MPRFIELVTSRRSKIIVNVDHIVSIEGNLASLEGDGTFIRTVTGSDIVVQDSYSDVIDWIRESFKSESSNVVRHDEAGPEPVFSRF